jgi:hypothetical protein
LILFRVPGVLSHLGTARVPQGTLEPVVDFA